MDKARWSAKTITNGRPCEPYSLIFPVPDKSLYWMLKKRKTRAARRYRYSLTKKTVSNLWSIGVTMSPAASSNIGKIKTKPASTACLFIPWGGTDEGCEDGEV